jgi:hypothetical protein
MIKVYPLRSVQNEAFTTMSPGEADDFIDEPGSYGLHEFRIFNQVVFVSFDGEEWSKYILRMISDMMSNTSLTSPNMSTRSTKQALQVIADHWAKKRPFDWHLPFFGERGFDRAIHALRTILNNALAGKRDPRGLAPWSRLTNDTVNIVYAVLNEVIASAFDSPGGHARCRKSFVAA